MMKVFLYTGSHWSIWPARPTGKSRRYCKLALWEGGEREREGGEREREGGSRREREGGGKVQEISLTSLQHDHKMCTKFWPPDSAIAVNLGKAYTV